MMTDNNLTPYPTMKPSGVPWLGDVPAHWQVLRGKHLFQCIDVRSTGGSEELLTVSSNYGVIPRKSATVTMFKAESYVGYKLCWPNDLVINSLWAWSQGLGVSKYHGIVSSAYGVYRCRQEANLDPWYVNQLVRSTPFQWELQIRSKGIWTSRLQLTDESFLDAPFVVPPLSEQRAIVRYLDYVDRRIRRYIRAKQKLIKLLEEQKQAIIHRAVTRGLDPDVRPKPSGVEWLGDVPAHWEVKRVKYLLQEVDNRSSTGEETLLSLRMNHGIVPHDDHFARPGQASSLVGYKLVQPGQVVLNRLQANNGLIFASTVLGLVSPDYAVFDPIEDVDVQYITALFRTPIMKHRFRVESKGLGTGTAGFLRLYTDRFGMIPVPVPPCLEQAEIMQGLDVLLGDLTHATRRVEREIQLLREYRTRLIADVVTGKLDVRGAAARLPAAEEEPGAADAVDVEEADDPETDAADAEEPAGAEGE